MDERIYTWMKTLYMRWSALDSLHSHEWAVLSVFSYDRVTRFWHMGGVCGEPRHPFVFRVYFFVLYMDALLVVHTGVLGHVW